MLSPAMKPPICRLLLRVGVATAIAGCDRPQARPALADPPPASIAPGSTIDSLLPIEESLRRFREGLPATTKFEDAAPSLDSLVAAVLAALEAGDTTRLGRMAISRAEYGYLYYPTSTYASKPYELAPDVAWMLSSQSGEKGRTRLMQRLGGRELRSDGYRCGQPSMEAENRIWRDCTVTFIDPVTSSTVTRQLFGSVIEREGRFKLLSFANDF